MRLDLWLWAARFFKTRSLSRQAVDTGKVEVGGQKAKPSRMLRGGESLRVERAGEYFEVTVLALDDVRGSAARCARNSSRRAAERTGYQAPEHKPDKRARRLIRALGDIDAT